MIRRALPPVAVLAVLLAAPAAAGDPAAFGAEELIRAVARAQRRADRAVTAATFDQVEVRTDYGKDGRPASVRRRRFEYYAGDDPRDVTRALVEVDGRPPTEKELREEAKEEARRKEEQREREGRAMARPRAGDADDEDPLVGPRRLSDLIARFSYGPVEEVLWDDRPAYALAFSPRPGLTAASVADRALNSLSGTVVVDAAALQVVSVDARLVSPVKVGGGIALYARAATIRYRAQLLPEGAFLPCVVELRVQGRTGIFFRLDSAFRFEFSGFARYLVEVGAEVAGSPSGPRP